MKSASILVGTALLLVGSMPMAGLAQDVPEKPQQIIANHSGGVEQDSLRAVYFDDFETETGIRIVDSFPEDFGKLRAMVESGNLQWTVTQIANEDAVRAVQAGFLEPLDFETIDTSGFLDVGETDPHLFGDIVVGVVMAYRNDAFPEGGPQTWADFWDVERFPGPRAMRNSPVDTLEQALLADGVRPEELYPLDVDRAFRKLDEIFPHVSTWWTSGAQQAQLLIDEEVVLTTGWNGRFFAAIQNNAPITMEYGEALLAKGVWGIPKGTNPQDLYWGQQLLAFLTDPVRQAAYAELMGYPGLHRDSAQHIRADLLPLMPTAPENLEKAAAWTDVAWWADNNADLTARWNEWIISSR